MRSAQPWRTKRARALRANATAAEDKLWLELKGRRLEGLKFVRQMPIGTYFVDFACREARIVVEIDGGTHRTDEELAADRARTRCLESAGYRVFRAQNIEVFENIDGVVDSLLGFVRKET